MIQFIHFSRVRTDNAGGFTGYVSGRGLYGLCNYTATNYNNQILHYKTGTDSAYGWLDKKNLNLADEIVKVTIFYSSHPELSRQPALIKIMT